MPAVQFEVLPGGTPFLKLSGDMTSDRADEIDKALADAKDQLDTQFSIMNEKQLLLLDMGDFSGKHDPAIMKKFTTFAQDIREKIQQVFAFNANPLARLAASAVVTLSGNDNMQTFATKEEAMQALEEYKAKMEA